MEVIQKNISDEFVIMGVREFRKLVTVDEAKSIIQSMDAHPRITAVELEKALGCALAEDVVSLVDVPPFNRASMDGYAVHASDTYEAREDRPVRLALVGSIPAGINPDFRIRKGEAAEIATGAVMPEGADSVVMVEYTSVDTEMHVRRPVSINENVMPAGSDIMIGERVLKKGTLLGAREIGVLAAIGKKKVGVFGLNVGIISTGDELAEPGCELNAGKIYDINSFSLFSGVKECGATPVRYGIVRDDENKIRKILREAAQHCDIILTSGSTSAGWGDIMYRIIEENGTLLVHGIDIKPGKPVIIGMLFGKPFFGLPGYPTSSLIIFNEFVAPLVRKMTGRKEERIQVKATLAAGIRPEGRTQLLPVGIVRGFAYPIEKGSGAITTLSEADGFIKIPANVDMIKSGEVVDVTLFGEPQAVELLFVGSHCLGLDTLADLSGLKIRVINVGSSGGLSAIRNGIADIAGVHLLDESGVYNIPYLERFGINNAVIVKGYKREQGLIVRRDSRIAKFEDIINARIINRNTGSGTRVITDRKLREVANKRGIPFEELTNSINGYYTEAKTHSAVAAAVKLGKADVGVGIRPVAEMNGLKFIKIADEEYDFVIPSRLLDNREMGIFIEVLRGKEFRERLPLGISVYERTGEVVEIRRLRL